MSIKMLTVHLRLNRCQEKQEEEVLRGYIGTKHKAMRNLEEILFYIRIFLPTFAILTKAALVGGVTHTRLVCLLIL